MNRAIAVETPLQNDLRALVSELDAEMRAMEPDTPDDCNFPMSVEEMAGPDMTVFVARDDGAAVGCCALRDLGDGLAEVKRLYVRPQARGSGFSSQLIAAVEAEARRRGVARLALETGLDYHGARKAYERAGFTRCAAFGDYPENPYSAFYDKALVPVGGPDAETFQVLDAATR